VPQTKDEDRKPPAPEAWARAPRLIAQASTPQPGLISDGGGLPFSPERPFEPFAPLDPREPPVAALLVQIDRGRQQAQPTRLLRPKSKPPPIETAEKLSGWRELARAEDEVLYARGRPPHLLTVAVRRGRMGRWAPLGASNSRPLRAIRDGVRASSWRLDPTFSLSPELTALHVLVTEQTMASGTPVEDRLLTPDLHLGSDRAVLRVYVQPLEGYIGRTSRHETPVIVALPEPLGARQVIDGALYEPPLG
jgi:hypothetical protein